MLAEDGKIEVDVAAFRKTIVNESYPNIEILDELNETAPLVIGVLEDGDIPIIARYNGERKVPKRISPSAYNIDRLLRTSGSLKVNISEEESVVVNTIADYLEVVKWICS